jgi:hypothetical protein
VRRPQTGGGGGAVAEREVGFVVGFEDLGVSRFPAPFGRGGEEEGDEGQRKGGSEGGASAAGPSGA